MTLSEELQWRGQIKDKTFEDITWLDTPRTFYLGVDAASAASMTIGNLAVYMLARRLLDHGWKTYLLVGGATSLIGDAGGRTEERELKAKEAIAENINGVKAQVQRLFSGQPFTLVDNADWLLGVRYLDFLRDVGKHFSMTDLLQREYIIDRIGEGGSGISYAEFSYSLIQGYDFWHLNREHDIVMQIGGSDQWGNMLPGVALIRKKENVEAHALSAPLVINRATGKKFGKSEEGAVWLDENLTSVYKFYQFWLNVDDEGVIDYMKIYTLLSREEIERIQKEFETDRAGRLAQKTLAYEVTKLVHGQDRADSVKRLSEVLFGGRDYADLTSADFDLLKGELPYIESGPTGLADILVAGGLASSKSEARRFLESKAVYVNGAQVGVDTTELAPEMSLNGYAIIRRGKNSQLLYRF